MEAIKKARLMEAGSLEQFTRIWEGAVRATHHFLSEQDIEKLKPLVKEALGAVEHLYYFERDDDPLGFVGVEKDKMEMLFIDADVRGRGIGRQLATFAIQTFGVIYVDVNEQNPQAIGFYEHLGFERIGRSELDEQGNPFPLLHLQLKTQ